MPSGQGNGTVSFEVPASATPTRSATITIAGQKVSVIQSEGCAYTIAPTSATLPSTTSTGKIAVTAGHGCSWTAASQVPWLTITSGASGSGNGEVQFTAAATTGPARSGTMTIAGQIFSVTQGEGCMATLSPSSATVDDAGGEGLFTVQMSAGCSWTATSTTSWLTIVSGASGKGQGTVRFAAARNTGPSRSTAITAGGQTFTVTQGNGCSISLATFSFNAAANGGTGSVNVTAGGDCDWTATSNAGWVTITSGANGSGNGSVGFTVAANSGAGRQATLTVGGRTIAGQTFTLNQASGCSYALSPASQSVGAAGGR
jgi:Viral BACON domain/Putative binding domain, N-terminal